MSTEPPLKGRQSSLSSQHEGHKGETRAVALSLTVLPSGTCNDSKANQKSSGCDPFTQSSVGKQLTTSVTDENPRKGMLGSVLKGTGVEGFELDLRGSSLVLDKKKFKTEFYRGPPTHSSNGPQARGALCVSNRLNDIKVSMLHCMFVLSPALGGT